LILFLPPYGKANNEANTLRVDRDLVRKRGVRGRHRLLAPVSSGQRQSSMLG